MGKQSSIVTVKPKQIKDLIQLENKSCKVSIDPPVKLEVIEAVKLNIGPPPNKLKATKLMCEESDPRESIASGGSAMVKNLYKMGNIDCLGKSSDKKTGPLLFSESDKLKTSNIADKSREELVSNL